MANVAFGVRQTADGIGTTDTDIRHMLAHKWLNKGVVGGLQVSGGSTMAYNVSAGMAICSRGASDGFTEAYWSGGATPTVEANASSNPRIDVVWITAHDMSQGDADNLVTIGVTKGTAAASPSAPTIPTYATPLAHMLVPSGATNTQQASNVGSADFAIPYGASLGILLDTTDTTNADVSVTSERTISSGTIYLPTDRAIDIKFTITMYSPAGDKSIYVRPYIDGVLVRSFEVALSGSSLAVSQYFEDTQTLAAGNHSIRVAVISATTSTVHCYYSAGGWAGQRVQVVDAGVAV